MNSLNRYAAPFYCIMRFVVGLMFFCHGAQKLFGWFAPPSQAGGQLPPLMVVGGWIEIVAGLLIAVGLLTRFAAFIASGEMAVAFFMMHAKGSILPIVNKGELAVVYCFLFFYIFLYGPGRWSFDAIFGKKSGSTVPTA
jgi:putative oxidoreductase